MIIDQSYKGPIHIRSNVGDATPEGITVWDVTSGKHIEHVFRAEITLDAEKTSTVVLTYYEANEKGIIVGKDDKPIVRTVTVQNPGVDVSAFEVKRNGRSTN